ncbi:MAG: transglutaminase-like domain-containing protein [Butyrivibrio sp.]|nr:transglutaminase-like domain-containing protein [Butyrivibrio sp.]
MRKHNIIFLLMLICCAALFLCGCGDSSSKNPGYTYSYPTGGTQKNDATGASEQPSTVDTAQNQTAELETPTEPPVTEPPTQPYIGPWTLLSQETLTPTRSGYPELDTLVDELIAKVVTDEMNNYQKVWALYEWMIDNITYSRGMDANTGAYSSSDPNTTPKEVLWATDLLNSGQGCCYNYSSAFVYIMRALGYDAHLVSGNVPKYGGGETPHCWLYVVLDNGQQYTFDPDLDMNFYTRELGEGAEAPAKDRFFCAPIATYEYFYTPTLYHTN